MDTQIGHRARLFGWLVCAGLAGCGGMPMQEEIKHVDDATYTFEVQPVRVDGAIVGINVRPNPAMAGLYDGGHARIEVPSGGTQKIVWVSAEPFTIEFEDLKSNKGTGGGKPDAAATGPVTAALAGGQYSYGITLAKGSGGGKKAVSSKYFLRMGSPQYVLDPVIIVDR